MSISEKIIAYMVSDEFILAAVSFTVGFVVGLVSLLFDGRKRR